MKNLFFIITILFLTTCKPSTNITKTEKLFKIEKIYNYYRITVIKNKAKNTFYLAHNKSDLPDSLKNNFIKIPVNRVICLSTTHLGYIEALNETKSVVGVPDKKYVFSQKLKDTNIENIGSITNLDIEKVIKIKPDVVFAFDYAGADISKLERLGKFGIKVVPVYEFNETEALSRSEWIKFFGLFYDKLDTATKIFEQIKANYMAIKAKSKIVNKPGILVNLPFQGVWYLPEGNSYLANLIEDAGGNYLWKNHKGQRTFTASFEQILAKNDSIDILINAGLYNSLDEIRNSDERLNYLNCIKKAEVYNNDKRKNGYANDFWESGSLRCDLIIYDLHKIFIGDTYNLYYYRKLK